MAAHGRKIIPFPDGGTSNCPQLPPKAPQLPAVRSDRQKFFTMLALIAYACFWAYLGALFVEYVAAPLEIERRDVLAFEAVVRPDPPECGEADDLYRCLNP